MLVITTPAPDLTLLSLAELRQAINVATGEDSKIDALNKRVAAMIARACRVAAGGAVPPTLRLETLTETLRLTSTQDVLILSRRPVVSVTSLTEDGTAVVASDHETEAGSGFLKRLSDDAPTSWSASKIVIVYRAGWETVPDDLKAIAAELAQTMWADADKQDSSLRSEDIPGVISRTYWVDNTDIQPIPEKLQRALSMGGYVNYAVA